LGKAGALAGWRRLFGVSLLLLGVAFFFLGIDPAVANKTSLRWRHSLAASFWTSQLFRRKAASRNRKSFGCLALCAGLWVLDGILIYRNLTVIVKKKFIISKWNRAFYGVLLALPVLAALFQTGGKKDRMAEVLLHLSLASRGAVPIPARRMGVVLWRLRVDLRSFFIPNDPFWHRFGIFSRFFGLFSPCFFTPTGSILFLVSPNLGSPHGDMGLYAHRFSSVH
jgi:hypothetical protein